MLFAADDGAGTLGWSSGDMTSMACAAAREGSMSRRTHRRPKFYVTRHSFISGALTGGMNLKALGEYVGTSVAMIENRHQRFVSERPAHSRASNRSRPDRVVAFQGALALNSVGLFPWIPVPL